MISIDMKKIRLSSFALALLTMGTSSYAAPVTLGNAFLSANASSEVQGYEAAKAIDADDSNSSRWQANSDASITLDTGAPTLIQGLYLWMSDSNSKTYWVKVETSLDGQQWTAQWRAITTKKNPDNKPIYLPMPISGDLMRYVKVNGAGNQSNNEIKITEARWLAQSEAVANNADIHRAHWQAPSPTNYFTAQYAASVSSWTLTGTQHLTLGTLQLASLYSISCPLADARVFTPQLLGVDATGEMSQFLTIKNMPDGSIAYAMDWDHVNLTPQGPGIYASYAAPSEMGMIGEHYTSLVDAVGTTREAGQYSYGCDPAAGDSHHSLQFWYTDYVKYINNGIGANHILSGWDAPITPEADPAFTIPALLGLPFETVTGTEGELSTRRRYTNDGFIDSGSRWSTDSTTSNPTPKLHFSTGPGDSSNPTVRGLFIWTHRSNVRGNKMSITARADAGIALPIIELTLPQVPESQAVFIPVTAGDVEAIKHVTIKGLGNDGGGNSDPKWSSIAEVRYSDSSTPPAGVVAVSLKVPHAVAGNAFCGASYNSPRNLTWAQHLDYQNNFYSATGVETVLDGNVAASNYWASSGWESLNLDLCGSQKVSKVNLWMHKSDQRTSTIDVYTRTSPAQGVTSASMTNVLIPISPPNTPTQIVFNPPVVAGEVNLEFFGNSLNQFNSIAEVSWE